MDCGSTIVKVTGYEIVTARPQYAVHMIKIMTSGLSMWEVRRRYTDFVQTIISMSYCTRLYAL